MRPSITRGAACVLKGSFSTTRQRPCSPAMSTVRLTAPNSMPLSPSWLPPMADDRREALLVANRLSQLAESPIRGSFDLAESGCPGIGHASLRLQCAYPRRSGQSEPSRRRPFVPIARLRPYGDRRAAPDKVASSRISPNLIRNGSVALAPRWGDRRRKSLRIFHLASHSVGPPTGRHNFRMLTSRAGRRCSSRYSRCGVSTSSIHFMNARTRRDRLLRCATTRDTASDRRRKSGMISTSAPLSKYRPIPRSGA
jgi:hypothetical protein